MTAKGFGWVGRVDWVDVPPTLPVDVRMLLDDALDAFRAGQMDAYLGSLVSQHSAMFHPINPAAISDAVSNSEVVAYWANAHGSQVAATLRKMPQPPHIDLRADQHIQPAMANRAPMKFSLLIHSEGMVIPDPPQDPFNRWSYYLRKGQVLGTVVIGLRWTSTGHQDPFVSVPKMSAGQWISFHIFWMPMFFMFVGLGYTFKRAFDVANFSLPHIAPYMVFEGDPTTTKADLA